MKDTVIFSKRLLSQRESSRVQKKKEELKIEFDNLLKEFEDIYSIDIVVEKKEDQRIRECEEKKMAQQKSSSEIEGFIKRIRNKR